MGDFGVRIQMMAVQMVPFIMAVVFHEFAHGFVANRWGDSTARDQGRLTLNPTHHIDPIGTLLFPMINMLSGIPMLIGWAKPVPINPTRFRRYRPGLFWVSFAGPSMNFLLAFLSAGAYVSTELWMNKDFSLYTYFQAMFAASISMNFALGIFNLLPLPPLDGSKMIESFLSYNATRSYERIAPYSFFILMGLMITGAFQILMGPIQFLSHLSVAVMAALIQGGAGLVGLG